MKKTYNKPSMEVVKIAAKQQILAGSLNDTPGDAVKGDGDYSRSFSFDE